VAAGGAGGTGRGGAAAGGGACGGCAAGGAGRCGGGAAGGVGLGAGAAAGGGGGVGRGGAAAGGAGRCGGAAAGGAGCGGGGAPFGGAPFGGAPFGGCLGFPSGPSSGFGCACAITSGAVCACDGALTNCIAVRAVVASSTSRSFVMMILVPRKIFGRKVRRYTNKRRAALWRPENADLFIFYRTESLDSPLFIAHSGDGFEPQRYMVPCGISDASGFRSGSEPGKSSIPASVAG